MADVAKALLRAANGVMIDVAVVDETCDFSEQRCAAYDNKRHRGCGAMLSDCE